MSLLSLLICFSQNDLINSSEKSSKLLSNILIRKAILSIKIQGESTEFFKEKLIRLLFKDFQKTYDF
jgi:hypothetical protein